jgi:hypothetical protein
MSEELGRRAVKCARWRWMPGMRAVSLSGKHWRVWSDTRSVYEPEGCMDSAPAEWSKDVPDLTDPATLGCLVALVREAWGDPALSVTAGYTKDRTVEWEVEHPHPDSLPEALWTYFDTEAEALVVALEAAPWIVKETVTTLLEKKTDD